jgi:putative restriction endonuclease
MANCKLEKISNKSWKHPFKDRITSCELWSSEREVRNYCKLEDAEKRRINIKIENMPDINITDIFSIASGKQVRFNVELQNFIEPIIRSDPTLSIIFTILDFECNSDEDFLLATTSGSTTIKTRIGQKKFREELVKYWNGCAVTEVSLIEILKASHIKPWKYSSSKERIDEFNGLLLNPMLDTLFDKGFITFSDDGKIKISAIIIEDCLALGVSEDYKINNLHENHKIYLKYHRSEIFKE